MPLITRQSGEWLLKTKAQLGHGKFGPWLKDNWPDSLTNSSGLHAVGRRKDPNPQRAADLDNPSIRSVLKVLTDHIPAPPSEEEAARIRQERAAAAGAALRANQPTWAAARIAAFQAGMKPEPPLEPSEEDWAKVLEDEQRYRASQHLRCACRYAYDAGISDDEFIAAARKLLAETRRKAEIADRT